MQISQTDYEILEACCRQLQNFLPSGFTNQHHQMQETCNNCFGLKKKKITRPLVNSNVCCCHFLAFMLIYFCLMKGCVRFFQPEAILVSFLHHMVLICKIFISNNYSRVLEIHLHKIHIIFRNLHSFLGINDKKI